MISGDGNLGDGFSICDRDPQDDIKRHAKGGHVYLVGGGPSSSPRGLGPGRGRAGQRAARGPAKQPNTNRRRLSPRACIMQLRGQMTTMRLDSLLDTDVQVGASQGVAYLKGAWIPAAGRQGEGGVSARARKDRIG